MGAPEEQSLGTWAVLALLSEGDTHGWMLVRALAPDGDIGRVWSIRRALVYRTIDLAVEAGFAERTGVEPGARGSPRTLLRLMPAGRSAVERWLNEPVAHVRDLRSGLLLKLLFAQRSGLDRVPLLVAQREVLVDTADALETQFAGEQPSGVTLRAFRLETARAGLRFIEGELARLQHARP